MTQLMSKLLCLNCRYGYYTTALSVKTNRFIRVLICEEYHIMDEYVDGCPNFEEIGQELVGANEVLE